MNRYQQNAKQPIRTRRLNIDGMSTISHLLKERRKTGADPRPRAHRVDNPPS
jgi:hypothetical protein